MPQVQANHKLIQSCVKCCPRSQHSYVGMMAESSRLYLVLGRVMLCNARVLVGAAPGDMPLVAVMVCC